MPDSQRIVRWETPEYIWRRKTIDWFWAVGIITVATSVIAVLVGDTLFAIFILLCAGMLAYFKIRKPEIVTVEINDKGLRIKETFYNYKNIDAFWIDNEGNDNQLLILTKRFFVPLISIPLADASADEIREILSDHVEERELSEPPTHKILESFGL